ncbi:unnamed protein product [Leptidea sinapis]|uniref:Major facilitator superfamily (MFS) profile domain-containing protein n=1 Tax=Leptidea sinapis TaxID=189913 RepID=A0A5E4QM47_9NEOP|nr:unnamed protein product [Leptidea sinapis]
MDITKSNIRLTDNTEEPTWPDTSKRFVKKIRVLLRETTVEPCLFTYMLCTSISSLAVQNMHLEKSCRVNYRLGDDICNRISARNTTGLDEELNNVQSLVAQVVAWKFPLQTAIPAVMVLFVGAWSDRTKKRKICILLPFIGEIIANIGLLLATYYFYEVSLTSTALIEALPSAFTGSYIIIFIGMYSFMADRTTIENRTFRLGLVTLCVSAGTPSGTALSGIALKTLGYYGVFSLLLVLHILSFLYGLFRLEDVLPVEEEQRFHNEQKNSCNRKCIEVLRLVANTMMVVLRPRAFGLRTQIIFVAILYFLMVGPLYGDSQVSYLYAIRKFNFNEVEYRTFFCITVLSKKYRVEDSIIGALAAVSRIAACFVFAFAPSRTWYYLAPVFNIFSHTGLTAVRSIATKSVSTKEVAKLSSIMGVMEAMAPSIYMPTSSYIYVSTIQSFPGAFYLFDATLTVFALGLFAAIYTLVRKRNKIIVRDASKKEEIARSNEVSRF